jgi:hypothetical protein
LEPKKGLTNIIHWQSDLCGVSVLAWSTSTTAGTFTLLLAKHDENKYFFAYAYWLKCCPKSNAVKKVYPHETNGCVACRLYKSGITQA